MNAITVSAWQRWFQNVGCHFRTNSEVKICKACRTKEIFIINVYLLLEGGTKLTDIANTEDFGYAGDE